MTYSGTTHSTTTRHRRDRAVGDGLRRESVRRLARGMTLTQALLALDEARRERFGEVEESEWVRINRLLLSRPAGARYNPGMDRHVQTELAIAAHRDAADAQAARVGGAGAGGSGDEGLGAAGEITSGQALEALGDALDAAALTSALTSADIEALGALADERPLTTVLLAAWLRRAYASGLEQVWQAG